MTTVPKFYLASTSPRRREILATLGASFEVVAVEVNEEQLPGESPADLVLRLASDKAAAASQSGLVLGADTVVVSNDRVLGKPVDRDDAVEMLLDLSGKTHCVMTGIALRSAAGTDTALSTTRVRFREIRRDEALAYWHSGEPRDKAGAYGIQGKGGMFVESIDGSYSGVMGLAVFETVELLRRAGIELLTT